MAFKFTEEQLNTLDKSFIVNLFLQLQDQNDKLSGEIQDLNKKMEVLIEQITLANKNRFGRASEKMMDTSQICFMEVDGTIVFFNEAEKQLLAACILYAAYQKPEYKNFFFVSKILLKGLSKEETSIFEFLIDTFSKVSDISIAEELSMTLKHFSERMLKILVPILCHKIMEIAEFVKTDDMDLERFADEKTIIFLITGPKESTYDFLVPLFIEQSFKEFVKQDNSATLKNHIYYVLDEFAQVRNIHNLEHMIATGKDYNISFLVSVMTIEQMKMLYPDYWLKIVNCFPNFVYMGSYDTMTIEYMKKLLEPTGIFDEVFLKETGKDNPKTRKEKMLYEHLAEKELYGTMDSTIIVTNRTYSFRKNITKPSKM